MKRYLPCALLTLAIAATAAPDELKRLNARKNQLERELEQVNARIAVLESTSPEADQQDNIYVTEFGIYTIDTAGGVTVFFAFKNPSPNEVVKYFRMQVIPYNRVGDVVSSTIGSRTTVGLEWTGPLRSEDGIKNGHWSGVWYNSTVDCVKLQSLQVVLTSGKVLNLAGKSLDRVLGEKAKNDCRQGSVTR